MVQRTSVGLDVHARSVVGAAIDGQTGEVHRRKLTPDRGEILAWVSSLPTPVKVVYEAGPTGFGLARFLLVCGVDCVVAAPSKLQRPAGDRVKTDPLTELSTGFFRRCVRSGSGVARFRSRDQRRGCAARVVRVGGAAARLA